MANYSELIARIQNDIYENTQNEITGDALQGVLLEMVNELGRAGAVFGGVVSRSFDPQPTDSNIYYFAGEPGAYTNLGLTVSVGELAILYFDGTDWQKVSVGTIAVQVATEAQTGVLLATVTIGGQSYPIKAEVKDTTPTPQSDHPVTSGGVSVALTSVVQSTAQALALKADKSTLISTGTGLEGGGSLAENRTIRLDNASQQGLQKAGSALQPGDIVNDLTTGGADKPLSAEQGKNLKTDADTLKSRVDDIVNGTTTVPHAELAENLASWEEQDNLSVEDTFSDVVRTTAGDVSVDSSAAAVLVSIVAKTNFYASALKATGFNLLRGATSVGTGFYFLVPALLFGTFGTAAKPNGLLFTDSNHINLRPTVRFKALSAGVPTSINDGSACPYTDSHGYRFYNPAQVGYIIVSGITLASTCAHIGWSRRYDDYISVSDAGDAGSSIALGVLINSIHASNLMYVAGGVSDRIDFGTSVATWRRRVERAQLTWTNEDNGDGTYTHSATISAMKIGGQVEAADTTLNLTVSGTTVSYTDSVATGTTGYIYYELAAEVTGTRSITPNLSVEDWGLELLETVTGSAYITMQYAQGYPDSLAALVSGGLTLRERALVEATAEADKRLQSLEESQDQAGHLKAESIDAREMPKVCGSPLVLYAAGVPDASLKPVNWSESTQGVWIGYPSFIGQMYVNTTAGTLYVAVGTEAVNHWKQV